MKRRIISMLLAIVMVVGMLPGMTVAASAADELAAVAEKHTVSVTATPTEGGTVSGDGTYAEGASVTVTATANNGYKFVKWTENGSEVSTDESYTFDATADHALVAVFQAVEMITITIESPRGQSEEIEIDSKATVGELKAAVADKFNVTFDSESEYRLFGGDLSYPNSKLDDDTKVLSDIGFANGQTIHLEKSTNWDSSTEPVKIFGLTITGGKGSQESYGDYNNVDYYWNYYYKTIIIKSDVALSISGTGEFNTNIIIKSAGSGKYTNLTISDLTLTNDDGACINVQGNSWVKLTVNGENTLTSTGENAPYTVNKVPALTLTNSGAYLKIMKASTGILTATTNIEGQPGIGTYDSTSDVWGVEINGGTIIANGGAGGAGIRASAVCIYGGNVTANGGIDAYSSGNALYSSPIEILGGTVIASSESGTALTKVPDLSSYKYYTATASTSADGTNAVAYDSASNSTYKYFHIESRATHIVTWVVNDGETPKTYAQGETPSFEGSPVKAAEDCTTYTFAGWSDVDGGEVLDSLPAVTEDITYYAIFTETANHGTENGFEYSYYGDGKHTVQCKDCYGLEENEETAVSCTIDKDTHKCIYCEELEQHTITFMNGNQEWTAVTCSHGGTLGIGGMPVPSKDGSIFGGWYTEDGTFVYHGMTVTSDLTAYARWITVDAGENGKLEITKRDEQVTVIVTPNEGYALETLKVGREDVTDKVSDGKYTFTMPGKDVAVKAIWEKTECPKDDTCPIAAFDDASPKKWYHDGVHFCLEEGLMEGYGGGIFKPDTAASRAMLVTMLWRMEGKPASDQELNFTDADGGRWYAKALKWAVEKGIIEGYPDGSVRPNADMTREEMVTILYRYAQYKKYDVSANGDFSKFTDAAQVHKYAKTAMQWAVGSGLIEGTGNNMLKPRDNSTRAQLATLMMRFVTEFEK